MLMALSSHIDERSAFFLVWNGTGPAGQLPRKLDRLQPQLIGPMALADRALRHCGMLVRIGDSMKQIKSSGRCDRRRL